VVSGLYAAALVLVVKKPLLKLWKHYAPVPTLTLE